MSLNNITHSGVLAAIDEFDALGRDEFLKQYGFNKARDYYLLHNGRVYDSKAIVGAAAKYSGLNGAALKASEFSGGKDTVVKTLKNLGFETTGSSENVWKDEGQYTKYWWVNHKQTYKQEVGGDYLWSPLTTKNGKVSQFYENMKRVKPGDIIFSFADAKIKALGRCTGSAFLSSKPEEFGDKGDAWNDDGWYLPVAFQEIASPLKIKDHIDEIRDFLPKQYSPIQLNGNGNQGAYLSNIPDQMAQKVQDLLSVDWSDFDNTVSDDLADDDVTDLSDDLVLAKLLNRTDLDSTQKLRLQQSRVGQGVYRRNLELFETRCRITGIAEKEHLRASHIKPWRVCSNSEKLDGNNGLLLSPHIDHLFDRGFISFTDTGGLLVSKSCSSTLLKSWSMDLSRICAAPSARLSHFSFEGNRALPAQC